MPDATEHFRFVLPARLEYRDAARGFLDFVCRRLHEQGALESETAHQVVSAFVEAFNNAVVHAYRDLEPGTVEVDLRLRAASIELQVSDQGRAFRIEEVREPDLDALPEGGLGIYIIKQFMDDVRYESSQDRNILHMSKSLLASGGGRADG
ncbi:MAG: ATP-binding protein [Myxococcota bacterium]